MPLVSFMKMTETDPDMVRTFMKGIGYGATWNSKSPHWVCISPQRCVPPVPPLHELIRLLYLLKYEGFCSELFETECMAEIRALLVRGAEADAPDVSDDDSQTSPLHEAALFGFVDIVELLHEFGASINIRDKMGMTPLHHGVISLSVNSIPVVKRLLSLGANPIKRCHAKWRPMDYLHANVKKRSNHYDMDNTLKDGIYEFTHCRRCDVEGGKLKTCTGCMHVRYCSVECQKLDWPDHKNARH